MWHVILEGVQVGPVPESQLVEWARSGKLKANDPVWQPGMERWLPAEQAGIFDSPPARGKPLSDDALMRAILPVGRSGWAIASGYLGLLSVLLIPAPFAVITGILAIFDIRHNREKHGMGRAIFGMVMGVLCLAIALALFLWLPD
ncbi:MAG: GYF domain-containing protein [Coriobacteriia bacterium]